MRRSDHIAAEQALQSVEDTARLIEHRERIVHDTMDPIRKRLDDRYVARELQQLAFNLRQG